MTNLDAVLPRRLAWVRAVPAIAFVGLALSTPRSNIDRVQNQQIVHAVLHGDLRAAYRGPAPSTSLPGFAVLTTPLAAMLDAIGLDGVGLAALAAPIALCAAAVYASRQFGLGAATIREVVLVLLLFACPGVFHGVTEYHHPQDVAMPGAVLLAIAFHRQQRWLAAGIALGLAIYLRQTAMLAVPAFALAWPRSHWSRLVPAIAVPILGTLPFLVADTDSVLGSLRAGSVVPNANSLASYVPFVNDHRWFFSRVGPFVVVAALSTGLALAWRRKATTSAAMWGAAVALMTSRVLLDPILYSYYLVPGAALFLALATLTTRTALLPALWVAIVYDLLLVPAPDGLLVVLAGLLFAANGLVAWFGMARAVGASTPRTSSHFDVERVI